MIDTGQRQGWHALPTEAVVARLGADPGRGLSWDEARRRLQEHGPNEVETRGGPGPLVRLLLQFHQPLIYILVAAAAVTLLLEEYVDAAVIFAVVVLNAAIGYVEESRALTALAAISRTLAQNATVLREGEHHGIPARELVPGDVVLIQSGDKVPADLRLVRVRELQVEEAALTGESVPVFKSPDPVGEDADLADRTGMAYSSTLVTSGRATGVVVATGASTEVGRISELMETAQDIATPLTRRIAWFSKVLLVVILGLAGLGFAVGLAHGDPVEDVFLASVALAVAAIPEGLPAVITITLAIGVARMAQRRAIIRNLPAVETLGSTTVVCSDKTGTLTENQMTVQEIWAGGQSYRVTGGGYEPQGEILSETDGSPPGAAASRCLLAGLLCNEASLIEEEGEWSIRGDPTEAALIVAAAKAGMTPEDYEDTLPRIDAIPFESDQQYMATLHRPAEGGENVAFVKGAAEVIVQACAAALGGDGEPAALDRDQVLSRVHEMAGRGLRVLAFAEKHLSRPAEEIRHDDVRDGLVFLGLQGMIDPPRAEAIEAVRACKQAGVAVKMITGDHAVTAAAIAHQLGIGEDGERPPEALTGRELQRLSDDELHRLVERVHVFARVPPDGKLRLVRALQSHGHVVAMTGDGVNDGPALRQADIGVAMGIAGTEVAKEAGDMVLADDNFVSIEAAIEEGRAVFDNLVKFLVWILPTNLGEGLLILIAIVTSSTLPMIPVQVLWVNMITAVFLGLTLAFEPKEQGIMERPPRDPRSPLIDIVMVVRMVLVAVLMVAGAYALFEWADSEGSVEEARTVVVNLFVLVEAAYLLNCRSMTVSMFATGLFSNPWIWPGIAVTLALQVLLTHAPFMHALFGTESIGIEAWGLLGAAALFVYLVVEAEKHLRARFRPPQPDWRERLPG